jgi:hypothetical protein
MCLKILLSNFTIFFILKIASCVILNEADLNPMSAYVLTDENGRVVDYGGVRLGLLDLEFQTNKTLHERYNLSEILISKLRPYIGLKGQLALKTLDQNPLALNNDEFGEMDTKLRKFWFDQIKRMPIKLPQHIPVFIFFI